MLFVSFNTDPKFLLIKGALYILKCHGSPLGLRRPWGYNHHFSKNFEKFSKQSLSIPTVLENDSINRCQKAVHSDKIISL